jgi:hypothetical protein
MCSIPLDAGALNIGVQRARNGIWSKRIGGPGVSQGIIRKVGTSRSDQHEGMWIGRVNIRIMYGTETGIRRLTLLFVLFWG